VFEANGYAGGHTRRSAAALPLHDAKGRDRYTLTPGGSR
jgi:hypothetical protein